MSGGIGMFRMPKTRAVRWTLLGGLAAVALTVGLWIGLPRRSHDQRNSIGAVSEGEAPGFERKNIHAMDIDTLKAYITACEGARDLEECERAYKRAIRLTRDDTSEDQDLIQLQFGLAGLYLNSLWEYGQFGSEETTPPALKRAIDIYDNVIAAYPDTAWAAEAQLRRAQVFHNEFSGYWNALHRDDAIREFRKVVEQYPGTPQARRAEQMLITLQNKDRG